MLRLLITFLIPGPFFAPFLFGSSEATSPKPNLCKQQEEVYFTSRLPNNKIVSICTSRDVSYTSGYLVYRYGRSIRSIELSLPPEPTEFRHFVTLQEPVSSNSGEEDEFIRFRNGKYSYVIYSAFSKDFDVHGLAVFKEEKLIRNMPSVPGTFEGSGAFENLRNLGVPPEHQETAQRIWKVLLPASSVVHSQRPSR